MKIGIDVSQIVYRTGVSNFTSNLVSKILEIDKVNDYVLFGGTFRKWQILRNFGVKKIYPFPPLVADLVWNKLHVLPVETFVGNVDVFQTSDWTCPPTYAKKIVPIFDMAVYKYPETVHPRILSTLKKCHEWAKKEASYILTISQSSKQDINEILGIPLNKIKVVYPAASSEYNKGKVQKDKKNYFLAVGTREPRKNFARLIDAFEKANIKDTQLWIVGKTGWGEEKFNNPNIKFLGFVDQKDMPGLYAQAKAFVYPSLYEGFGIPILEAMSVGCPVITSNVSSMPEAGGNAVTYVDPLSVESIASAIVKFTSSTDMGLKQAEKFSWENAAKVMVNVYEEINTSG